MFDKLVSRLAFLFCFQTGGDIIISPFSSSAAARSGVLARLKMVCLREHPQFVLEHPQREVFAVDAFLQEFSLLLPGVAASWYGSELVLVGSLAVSRKAEKESAVESAARKAR